MVMDTLVVRNSVLPAVAQRAHETSPDASRPERGAGIAQVRLLLREWILSVVGPFYNESVWLKNIRKAFEILSSAGLVAFRDSARIRSALECPRKPRAFFRREM